MGVSLDHAIWIVELQSVIGIYEDISYFVNLGQILYPAQLPSLLGYLLVKIIL